MICKTLVNILIIVFVPIIHSMFCAVLAFILYNLILQNTGNMGESQSIISSHFPLE